jgi:hypothetical protein
MRFCSSCRFFSVSRLSASFLSASLLSRSACSRFLRSSSCFAFSAISAARGSGFSMGGGGLMTGCGTGWGSTFGSGSGAGVGFATGGGAGVSTAGVFVGGA